MDSNALETARLRYRAAYDAYRERARRVAQKLEKGSVPTADEIADEARATEQLGEARRRLLDAMAELSRPR